MKHYKRCPTCSNPEFACTCKKPVQPDLASMPKVPIKAAYSALATPTAGYFKVEPAQEGVFINATLSEIVAQLESCGYRCEAGRLESNLAFIELKRRADAEAARIARFNANAI